MGLPGQILSIREEHDFLIGIDSDGCVFDSMEIWHKECFIPNTILIWELQPISKYVREVFEFINLYSRWRGVNRFASLINGMDLLSDRDEVKRRGFELPDFQVLKDLMDREPDMCNETLQGAYKKLGDPVLNIILDWSNELDKSIEKFNNNIYPFSFVEESIEKASMRADVVVLSSMPYSQIIKEWKEHDFYKNLKAVCGRETGNIKESFKKIKSRKYANDNVLMIGDDIIDMNAAKENRVLFYPINPSGEEASWQRFYEEAMDKFFNGEYKGAYQEKVIAEFEKYLPEKPVWKKVVLPDFMCSADK